MNLTEIGKLYGTDKVTQGFTDVYQVRLEPLRFKVQKLLEVGVFFGASLQMWRDYFPNAHVLGLDTFTGVDGWTNIWGDGQNCVNIWICLQGCCCSCDYGSRIVGCVH